MSFYKSIATVGGLTLGSRLLGFARDILTAAYLGAGPVADAFFVALKLPNFFRRITAEGAFSVSFVPLFAGKLEKDGREEAIRFAQEAQAVMFAVLLPFTIVAIAAMPWVLYVIAPGFGSTPERYDLAVELSRITFPYILFMSLTALLGGVMNSFNKFGPFAAAPMLFNLALIVALVFFAPIAETGGHAMAWGVSAAGVLQFLWLLACCRKLGVVLKFRRPRITAGVKKLFRKMVPGIFGAGVAQVNLFIDMILASLLPVGAISYLYYADRLYQLPLSVIGIAIGTAMLPMLTRALKGKDEDAARRLFTQGVDISLLLSLPATAAFFVIAVPIMRVLFERGAFTAGDSAGAAYALMAYAVGLPAYVLSKVFAAAFFAREDTATPVKFAVICAVLNTLVALALLKPLGHVGIALATGVTAWVNVLLLMRGLHRRGMLWISPSSVKRAARILLAAIAMAAVVRAMDAFFLQGLMDRGQAWRLAGLALVVGAGGGVYGILVLALRIVDIKALKSLFPKRKKQDTIGNVQDYGQ